ncbi:MAG: MFS transporter [Ferrimonas sp.]
MKPLTHRQPLYYMSSCYFLWGTITVICTSLLPVFRQVFELSYEAVAIFPMIFFLTRVVMSLPNSVALNRWGYRATLNGALMLCACACLGLSLALYQHHFELVLVAYLLLSMGISALQLAAQTYVSVAAVAGQKSQSQSFATSCNSLGTTVGPLLLSLVLASAASIGLLHTNQALALVFSCLCLLALPLWRISRAVPELPTKASVGFRSGLTTLKNNRPFIYAVIALILYMGVEVALGAYAIDYLMTIDVAQSTAISMASGYWLLMLLGRLLYTKIGNDQRARMWLLSASSLAIVGCLFAAISQNFSGAMVLLAMGLLNSAMYPIIYSRAMMIAGEHASQASALLIMATVGGALIPSLQGVIIGLSNIFVSFGALSVVYLLLTLFAALAFASSDGGIRAVSHKQLS